MPIIQQLLMDTCHYEAIPIKSAFDHQTTVHVMDFPRNVYKSLTGHSDIFACSLGNVLVVEPRVYEGLRIKGATQIIKGISTVGDRYPQTAHYNALVTKGFVLHNHRMTDPALLEAAGSRERIHIRQGYARCTTLEIAPSSFITSDQGIFEAMKQRHMQVDFISGESILLSGQEHGFIGGCCGVDRRGKLWLYGSLTYHPFGNRLKELLMHYGIEYGELLDAPLRDIGGLLFWDR